MSGQALAVTPHREANVSLLPRKGRSSGAAKGSSVAWLDLACHWK